MSLGHYLLTSVIGFFALVLADFGVWSQFRIVRAIRLKRDISSSTAQTDPPWLYDFRKRWPLVLLIGLFAPLAFSELPSITDFFVVGLLYLGWALLIIQQFRSKLP